MVFPKFVENVQRLPPGEPPSPQDRADFSGDTPLRTAAARGHEETVQCLVAKRADLTLGGAGWIEI